jgi:hypothetical protein
VLTDPWAVYRTEQLVEAARHAFLRDPAAAAEQDDWVDRSEADGIPGAVAAPRDDLQPGRVPTRFERLRA